MRTVYLLALGCGLTLGLAYGGAWIAEAKENRPPDYAFISDDPHLSPAPRTASEKARIAKATAPAESFDAAEPFELRPAGAATSFATPNGNAYSHPSANIDFEGRMPFFVGNGLFKKLWVSSPSSTLASDGLGPLYSARSCQRCHLKDGRGHPPEEGEETAVSMFLRISIPADHGDLPDALAQIEGYLATKPDPTYGLQLQDHAIAGLPAEYRLEIRYEEETIALSDGETASLRRPIYSAEDLGYGPLHPEAMLSPRVAPQMIGLGLLEAIPAEDILANADEADLDGDGISGKPNIVWSTEYERPMLGRFGLKAGEPTVKSQSAGAFAGDIGISSPLKPASWGECMAAQEGCRDAAHGAPDSHAPFEVSEEGLELVTFYSRNLAVPARRDVDDPQVLRGKAAFYGAGCHSCHTPKFVTHRLPSRKEQSFQLIWPYSDLLLHDMGEGLADRRPEARATGREWRTPPLWGIGLTKTVNGHTYFLHDGRARSLLEAILWHGGEAEPSKQAVAHMPKEDRAALIRFLESL